MNLNPVLGEKLNAALEPFASAGYTRRDVRLSPIAGKVHAVIGMRRTGKTVYLKQLLEETRKTVPAECAVYLSFDDDRLSDLGVDQLSLLLEEYYRRYPQFRGTRTVYWYLDEIQLVPGWDRFLRRVLDTERMEFVVSGSSARRLSREVHTSLRGRGTETVLRPFSFREFLRHRGEEPATEPSRWTQADRSLIEKRFFEFLIEGGFPEAQNLPLSPRLELLQSYVNAVLFRDVVERYAVTQVAALRWLVRHCLRNPARSVSVHKLYQDLKAQGLGVGKDSVHAMMGHLLDAFLVSAVSLATESERRRNSNPRKIYPADPGLIRAFDASGRSNLGQALETAIFNEIERRRAETAYVKTDRGLEVDFLVRHPSGKEELLQVCADPSAPETLNREVRALAAAQEETYPRARKRMLVTTRDQALPLSGGDFEVLPAYEWLLSENDENGGLS